MVHTGLVFSLQTRTDPRLDPKILRDETVNILLAGRDTVSGLLNSFEQYTQ